MNGMPLKEEIQKYLLRWQQLRAQYGEQVVNVPEYAQLTKLIKAFQLQLKQLQGQVPGQNPNQNTNHQNPNPIQSQNQAHQSHQNPNANHQNPQNHQNHQNHMSMPMQMNMDSQQHPQNLSQNVNLTQAMRQNPQSPSVNTYSQFQNYNVNNMAASQPPQQTQAQTTASTPSSFNYVPQTESPFSTQQIQLLKAQNLAVKYLFKNNSSFGPIPNNIIELAVNERMAYPDPALSQPPSQPSHSPAMPVQQPPPQGIVPQQHLGTPLQRQASPHDPRVAAKKPAARSRVPSTPSMKPATASGKTAVTMKEAPPVNINDLIPDKANSKKMIIPVSKPSLQVDTYEVPDLVGDAIKKIPYSALYVPQSRIHYPALSPEGISMDEVWNNKEMLLILKIEGQMDALRKKLLEIGDSQSEEAQIVKTELAKLELLPYQKNLKGKILSQIWFSKSLLPNSHPNFLAKFSSLSIESISATQALYQQQLHSLVQAKNKKHQTTISKIMSHKSSKHDKITSRREKLDRFSSKIMSFHNQIAKEEQKKIEKMAKQRLQALKLNDEEAYMKLLDHTKDTRITHLLNQTNQFLDSLAQAVQTQQKESSARSGREAEALGDEVREKIDYYHVAHRIKEEVTKQPSILVGGTLKEYQIKGLQWMVSLFNNHLNGILADEMGLGKTIQTISLITYLIEVKKIAGPFLVIVPLSTLTNWNLEFEKWAPSVKKITYKGTPNQRKALQYEVRLGDFQILLTTFEYIIKDRNLLSKVRWVHMIIDEGHRMKNAQSKLSETLTHHYHSDYRLILTGTPLQNNLPELWALLNFALPKIFNSVKSFDEWFNTPFANTGGQDKIELSEEETLLVIRRLHKVLRPFLLRRLKKDVEKDLPSKVEKVVKCKMSALQSKLYQQMLKHNVMFAGTAEEPVTIKNANNQLMQLRKICNHPFVYEDVENLVNPAVETNDEIWRVAGKFELLDKVLPKFKKTGHRVLIFFQMTQVMDIMEDFLRLRNLKYMRLDGATKSDDRTGLLKKFNAVGSEYFCFLLSTRAGGLGLNLQTADTVIIFDTDWNPHQDLQAQDRAHRIGQKNEVRILRLITEDSIEEMILERAHAKLEIDGKVIQAGKFDNKSTAEEQEALLRALLEKDEERRQKGVADEDEDLDDDELNQIIARNDSELDVFRELDAQRAEETKHASYPTRLFSEPELPSVYKIDPYALIHKDASLISEYGRGTRERKAASYDDNLTEEQWLKKIDGMVSDSDDDTEVKPKRSRGRPRTKKLEDSDVADSKSTSVSSVKRRAMGDDEELLFSQATKRQKSATPKAGKRLLKKGKGRRIPNRVTPSVDPLSPDQRDTIQSHFQTIYSLLMNYTNEQGRRLSDLFLVKPSKKFYPDYYVLIRNPIAMDTIKKRIAAKTYTNMREFLEDVHLMFSNARIFNEEGSIVYQDAAILENLALDKYKELAFGAEEVDKILDFREFDETYSLKPHVKPVQPPVEESVEPQPEPEIESQTDGLDVLDEGLLLGSPLE